MKKVLVAILAVVVLTTPGWLVGSGTASAAPTSKPAAASAPAHKVGANFTVKPGVVFNNPRRRDRAGAVIGKIRRAIQHVPKGGRIMVMSWNYNQGGINSDLVKAHRRGAMVRVIMARSLVNGAFRWLTRELAKGNGGRPGRMKSFTRTCSNTCRGKGGSMHSKLMILSRSGSTRNIVMQGSANFTGSAASNQWNDWYSLPNNKTVYKGWVSMFNQALKDRQFGTKQFTWKHIYSWFAPRQFGGNDPVKSLLGDVACRNAGSAGIGGRTKIRVASAVFQDGRGQAIARQLKALKRQGCNVRVVFTMMSNNIRSIIRGVPTRQLVYDWNGDGAFDRYLHMKAMTISGRFRGRSNQYVLFNGSANWSTMGYVSDEQGMVIRNSKSRINQYANWIDGLFNSAPRGLRPTPEWYTSRGLKNPYEDLELELEGQG